MCTFICINCIFLVHSICYCPTPSHICLCCSLCTLTSTYYSVCIISAQYGLACTCSWPTSICFTIIVGHLHYLVMHLAYICSYHHSLPSSCSVFTCTYHSSFGPICSYCDYLTLIILILIGCMFLLASRCCLVWCIAICILVNTV